MVYILSTVQTEKTYTSARLEALFKSSQSSPFVPSTIRSLNFLARDCVLGASRCFVKRSAVVSFVSTRSTDRRLHVSTVVWPSIVFRHASPPGPLRAAECVVPNLNPSRDELKRCNAVP